MAETAKVLTDVVLRRLRDPQGSAHSRALVRTALSQSQRLLNAALGSVTETITLATEAQRKFYPIEALMPTAARVLAVREGSVDRRVSDPIITSAFPAVQGRQTSFDAVVSTNKAITLPAGVQVGELLIVLAHMDANVFVPTPPVGWTRLQNLDVASAASMTGFWRRADGTEGASVTIVLSGTADSTHVAFRISGDSTSQSPNLGFATGSSSTPDSPSRTPVGGAKDYLWFTVVGFSFSTGVPVPPASYGNLVAFAGSSTSGIASAERLLNAVSEDPGAWNFAPATGAWTALTIAVHPSGVAEPGPPLPPLPDGRDLREVGWGEFAQADRRWSRRLGPRFLEYATIGRDLLVIHPAKDVASSVEVIAASLTPDLTSEDTEVEMPEDDVPAVLALAETVLSLRGRNLSAATAAMARVVEHVRTRRV